MKKIYLLFGILLFSCLCNAQTWSNTGSMANARSGHTATLLQNGKVLVTGNNFSCELYDPITGIWSNTGSMATSRLSHTATLLPNGKVLVTGGGGYGSSINSCELYDPATGTWSYTDSMATVRHNHFATLLPNGKVLITGGEGNVSYLNSCELYDIATGTWSNTGSIATARHLHTATLLPNGKVLVAGGIGAGGSISIGGRDMGKGISSCELYDPATGAWSYTGSMATVRYGHKTNLLPNNKVLVTGMFNINSCELYDMVTGTWSSTGSTATARYYHTATLLPNGKVLVTGGYPHLNSCELYDPATGIWNSTDSMATGRNTQTASLLENGKVLVTGGYDGSYNLNNCELYATTTAIPDPNFEQALIDYGYDDVIDGLVLTANISGLTTLDVRFRNISNLTGIQDFTSLVDLECRNNQLSSLNVSALTALTQLNCQNNQLVSLNATGCTLLTQLFCNNNLLTSLNLSGLSALETLHCPFNQLTSINISSLTSLHFLDCSNNLLTSLDCSGVPALVGIDCSHNQLTSLNVSGASLMGYSYLWCTTNPNLFCIKVNDVTVANADPSWDKDAQASYILNYTIPTFTVAAPICSGGTYSFPLTSNNGITGTWSPVFNNTTTTVYTFTPAVGECATTTTMTITVNPNITPSFTAVAAICSGGSLSPLPTTSNNGITGTWSPVLDNTVTTLYTFTPTAGLCATTATITITVNPSITPTFTQVAAICSGATLSALPTTSINGVIGTWSPALNNAATTLYTFTPTAGLCVTTATMTITVNPNVTPTFTAVAAICSGGSLSALPTTSNNGIIGTWSPILNNAATTLYTFTPAAGLCATTATMIITVNPSITPTFTQVAPIIYGTTLPALSTTSNNGITGTWSPELNNTATTLYTFTPTAGLCASSATMTIIVILPPSISYTTPQNYMAGTAITPLSPTNTGSAVPATVYGQVSTFAGSGANSSIDGTGTGAAIRTPKGATVDAAGNIYVTEFFGNKIRKITPAGVVTTFAGSGASGSDDGIGTSATFSGLRGLTIDSSGNLFVCDSNKIRKITPAGVVTTFAGGASSYTDATGTNAGFSGPFDITIDNANNLYVADYYNGGNTIRKITPSAVVTTFAGNRTNGSVDGISTVASFSGPLAITIDTFGNLYVAESSNRIRKVTPSGTVSTFAGSGVSGSADGIGTSASFSSLNGIAVDAVGNVFVSEAYLSNKIRKITPAGVVTTFAGNNSTGAVDGNLTAASFNYPSGLKMDTSGNLYVCDFSNNKIRKINTTGYAIAPILPTGLSFDATTGTISGTPTSASSSTNYTVMAYNTIGSNSTTVNIAVCSPITPNFTVVTPICLGDALSPLPPTSNNGITGTWSPALNNTSTTTYTFTPNAGQCAINATMTIIVNATLPPTASAQTLFVNSTVSDLVANGADLKWYDVATGGSNLDSTTVLTTDTYYVSQTLNGCESTRTAVSITISNIPIVSSPVTYCKGDIATPLTATCASGSTLKWYTVATLGTALLTAPTPVTTTVGSKTYYVSQVVNGVESSRVSIVVNVNALPATPGTITGTAAQGVLVGTTNTATYSILAVAGATTYEWTAPDGVNIIGANNGTSVTVNFLNVSAGAGAIGNLSVKSINASGCFSVAKTLALTKALPAAPTGIKMYDDVFPTYSTSTGLQVAITSFAKYMGTNRVLRLTAATVATATSYDWELPSGVNRTDAVGTNSTLPSITVNFSGVNTSNTFSYTTTGGVLTYVLRIGVKSKNGVGVSITNNAALINPDTTSSARQLSLTAVRPAAVSKVTGQIAGLCGGSSYNYSMTASALASSYFISAPAGSAVTSASNPTNSSNTLTTSDLTFNVAYPMGFIPLGIGNNAITIASVNGIGTSLTTKNLTLSTTMPAVSSISGGTTYSICNQTFTTPIVAFATTYTWTVPIGATIVSGQNTNTVVVNYGALTGSQTIKVKTTNACGVSSALKSLALTAGACPTAKQSEPMISLVNRIKLHPNPTSSILSFETTNNTEIDNVVIVDLLGKVIFEGRPENNQINVERFASGTYILQAFSGDERFQSKFIKE